jgi:magnesium transporter
MDYELVALASTDDEFENETEFLQSLLSIQDQDQLYDRVKSRLEELETTTDYAKEYSKMKSYVVAYRRIPAITTTILLELMVGYIVSEYAHVLEKHILLTSFLPVLSALGGNLGLQASSTTLRALGTTTSKKRILNLIGKETLVGMFIGIFAASITSLVGLIWSSNPRFAYTTFLSVLVNCTLGAVIGSLSPVIFTLLKIDPTLMSGPLGIFLF